tara:strand:- start:5729 stop:6874 length:1146 start_codon:yes stop_codon:yes gene_type:complete
MTEKINKNVINKITYLIKAGNLSAAKKDVNYALKKDSNSIFLLNSLSLILFKEGKLNESIDISKKILLLDDNNIDALINIGNSLKEKGEAKPALKYFFKILEIDESNEYVNYNIAMILYDAREFNKAFEFFKLSKYADFNEKMMQCKYKIGHFDEFNSMLNNEINKPNISRTISSLSAHASVNLKQKDDYKFCKNPLDFIYKKNIDDQSFVKELNEKIDKMVIDNRNQDLLKNGKQTAGNIFEKTDRHFSSLKETIFTAMNDYYKKYHEENNEFINQWPKSKNINGWIINMSENGFLKPHIHEKGWISGTLYLKLPKKIDNQGKIKFGIHGYDYPKLHDNFPTKTVSINEGDIIMFPSSLFHETIPFKGDKRICIAFDINP